MACQTIKLGDLCTVLTGAPMSRAKKLAEGETGAEVKVLVAKAMEDGRILDGEITRETVSKVKEDFFTREGDVIVKATTPFDCVYINKAHEGLLVTSFGMILRTAKDSPIDTRYLAACLNQPRAREALQRLSVGAGIRMIKNKALAGFEVPIAPKSKQARLAELFENTQKRKEQCLRLIAAGDELLEAEFSRIIFG